MLKRMAGMCIGAAIWAISGALMLIFSLACLHLFGNYPYPFWVDRVAGRVVGASTGALVLTVIVWRVCDICDR